MAWLNQVVVAMAQYIALLEEVIFLGGIQQSNLPPAYGFELEDLPDIGGADDETNAQEDHGLNDT
jgi:hypothetical protein